jgi:hypothetical protein
LSDTRTRCALTSQTQKLRPGTGDSRTNPGVVVGTPDAPISLDLAALGVGIGEVVMCDSFLATCVGALTLGLAMVGCGENAVTCDADDVCPCTEQGLRAAVAAGGGPYEFGCEEDTTILTGAEIVIDKNVILDGGLKITLDGNDDHRIFSIAQGVTAEISRFAITRGIAGGGGGIQNSGTLTLRNSEVSVNRAGEGGGIVAHRGSTTMIESCSLWGNVALKQIDANSQEDGGAILNVGMMTIEDTEVTDNLAGNDGGGIFNEGTLTLTTSTVTDNNGGGVSSVPIGGIGGGLTLTASTVSDNIGNGIRIEGTTTSTLANSTVSGNTGDGVRNHTGMLTLTNTTVSGNISAGSSGDDASTVVSTATLIDGACTTVVGAEVTWTSNGYNIESPGNTCGFDQTGDQWSVTVEQLNLGELADNDGPTMTHALGAGSVAIDQIPEAACEVETDQRGKPRPEPGGTMCDVGSFEAQPAP